MQSVLCVVRRSVLACLALGLMREVWAEDPPPFARLWPSPKRVSFYSPRDVECDAAGNVYVVDTNHDRLLKLDSGGNLLAEWGRRGSGNGEFYLPEGVAVGPAGHVYVTDRLNYRVQKFTSTGAYVTQWGGQGEGNGQFVGLGGIDVDASGSVYVADSYRLQKFTSSGTFLTSWGIRMRSSTWSTCGAWRTWRPTGQGTSSRSRTVTVHGAPNRSLCASLREVA